MSAATSTELPSYRGYRYPAEIISHAVWLYFRFSLSLRDVEELLAERGVTVTYETIRAWCAKFGPTYAAGLRRRRARPSDKWHLDEVQLKIKGKRHWLWRAVDKHGIVLDILVQQRRDQLAAEMFLPEVKVTDPAPGLNRYPSGTVRISVRPLPLAKSVFTPSVITILPSAVNAAPLVELSALSAGILLPPVGDVITTLARS